MIAISGSLIWSKTLMELIFNPCGKFWLSPEGPVSQIHSHLLVGAPGLFSDLLRSVQMLKREWGKESNGKLLLLFIPSKTAAWFLSLRWKTCLWAELQHWCMNLQWKICNWAELSDDDCLLLCLIYVHFLLYLFVMFSWYEYTVLRSSRQPFIVNVKIALM